MALAFLLINLAGLCRVVLPVASADGWYDTLLLLAGYGWLATFALFLFQYAPILTDSDSTAS
jgi:uncharacterized protein involved in response to NO